MGGKGAERSGTNQERERDENSNRDRSGKGNVEERAGPGGGTVSWREGVGLERLTDNT